MPTDRCESADRAGTDSVLAGTLCRVLLLAGTFWAATGWCETPGPAAGRSADDGSRPAVPNANANANASKSPPSRLPASKAASVSKPVGASASAAQRVALTTGLTSTHAGSSPDGNGLKADIAARPVPSAATIDETPVARALRVIKACQTQFTTVADYTCTFYKRERIEGRMTPLYVMSMKARSNPRSIYFRFVAPCKGREAIFVDGQNGGKILAHEVGFTKLLAGTLELEPSSAMAMEDNRHPITDAGIGALIDTVARRWVAELSAEESVVVFDDEMTIGPRRCSLVEAVHPRRKPDFQFHKVRLFIDSELKLPIRFEGYDWPSTTGACADLLEEYTYVDLKVNVGLGDIDFDACNRAYAFGRF